MATTKKPTTLNAILYDASELFARSQDIFGQPEYVVRAAHRMIGRPGQVTKADLALAVQSFLKREVS